MVRTAGSASFRYDFKVPPREASQIPTFLNDELPKIATAINRALDGQYELQTAAPEKPREGMVRFADGTSWDPGSGKGFYGYYTGAWHSLG